MFTRIGENLNTNQKYGYKKRGDWLLLVPRIEALRLPCSQERATIDPTLICIARPYKIRRMQIYTPMGIYRCHVL